MKQKLMTLYWELSCSLPAINIVIDSKIRKKRERVESILWGRYEYDISLSHQSIILEHAI